MLLMDLNEQADRDFSRARRKASLRRLMLRLRGELASHDAPISFDEVRRSLQAYNRVRKGIRVVDPEKIVGSVGRCRDFDRCFMPLRAAAGERWKRVDLAFHRDKVLPPVSLYKLGDAYFVEDGNHRVSVARYHGVPGVEAYVTEFRPARVESQDAERAVVPEMRAA
jgi:hypothetical protein